MAIGVLSFTVWVHHFFTMGQSADINAVFGIATIAIGVPTGVKIYDWIWTMFRGEVRFTVPMLYALAFMMTFVLGGFTGVLLAFPPLDYLAHNTLFLVAHFHNMLIPGLLYGMLAGYHYWFPKAFGFRLNEKWGRIAVGCWVVGFYLAFMPLYVLGAAGVARRTQEVFEPAFRPWLYMAGVGALVLLGALASLFAQLWVSIRQRDANRVTAGDPWDGRGLEWSMSSPPPKYNFALIPQVGRGDPFYDAKRTGQPYAPPTRYEDIKLPKASVTGPVIGVAGAATAFGLVWHMWWLAIVGLLVVIVTVIARSFVRDFEEVIDAAEVERGEAAWLSAVDAAKPILREVEMSSANQGLAKVSA
jgi:cytochrome o ubiquinol oxidase subunit 1